MKTKHLWLIVIGLGLIIAILAVLLVVLPVKAPIEHNINLTPSAPSTEFGIPDLFVVETPKHGALLKSPIMVGGLARGPWFFEGSFPVKIFDSNGQELGAVAAQTKENWMTAEFISFYATLYFETPATATGTLVFYKDNPSGLPQNDKKFELAVRFK